MSGSLTIVGTGFRLAGQVTPEALSAIRSADRLLYAVGEPATELWLRRLNRRAEDLADCYRLGEVRTHAYARMVARMLAPVRRGLDVCAAFYGHPGVFATAPHAAIAQARREGFAAWMQPGISAIDCLYADLGVDPGLCGCQIHEATDFLVFRRRFDPRTTLILLQIGVVGVVAAPPGGSCSRAGLRALTAELRRTYPASHEVVVYEASPYPVCPPQIDRLPLHRLPKARASTWSTLYVAPCREARPSRRALRRLGLEGKV